MEVPQAHESVDSRSSVAGGRQMSTAELAQMEAAGYGLAQQFATEAATMPGELLLPLLPGDRTAPHRQHAYVQVRGLRFVVGTPCCSYPRGAQTERLQY